MQASGWSVSEINLMVIHSYSKINRFSKIHNPKKLFVVNDRELRSSQLDPVPEMFWNSMKRVLFRLNLVVKHFVIKV
jgi:hypothetical protein